jgi:hypothetical protein
MTRSDWKHISKNRWQNRKNKFVIVFVGRNIWSNTWYAGDMHTRFRNSNKYNFEIKHFKTRPEAVHAAEKYMETH